MTASELDTQNSLVPENDWKTLLKQWERAREARWLRPLRNISSETLASIALSLILLGAFFPLIPSAPDWYTRLVGLKVTLIVCGFCLLGIAAGLGQGLTITQKQILADLENVEDTRSVGPLLQALDAAMTQPARMALMNVLTGLLPRLTEADRNSLTPQQSAILYGAIYSSPQITHSHPAFVVATLQAIAIVGDTNALPILARIIVTDAPTRGEQEAREQARLSLHRLMQTLDFGTVQDIPAWVANLPLYSENTGARLTPGVSGERSLIAVFALTRLLPQLTPEQGTLLSRSDRSRVADSTAMILFMLTNGGSKGGLGLQSSRLGADFKLAVIEALRNVGTGEDVGHMRHWAYAAAPSDADRQARELAREALPILEARREKEQAGLTLLRGASAPPAAPDQLLRPALSDNHNSFNTPSNELLHPHNAPQNEQIQNLSS